MRTKIKHALCAAALLACWHIEAHADADSYCEGYQAGFAEGYCHELEACLAPTEPLCPLPRTGKVSWSDGYGDGFRDGYQQPFVDAREYIDSLRDE